MSSSRGLERYLMPIFSLGAVFCLLGAVALAVQHPLWPAAVLSALYVWCVAVAWRPGIWLFVVPAALPFLNFAPWSGWLIFDEFDILLLGTLAAAYGRIAWAARRVPPLRVTLSESSEFGVSGLKPTAWAFVLLLGGLGVVALIRGWMAASGVSGSLAGAPLLAQAYYDPMNSVRVFKSLGFALFWLPLLRQETQTQVLRARASQLMGSGVLAALTGVALVVLWERAAFPDLLNFSSYYRTTALFWEMHVGGAAIDGFVAMGAPFVAWALWRSHRPLQWFLVALLAVLVCYAALTTFSRGVYLSVGLPLALLGLRAWAHKTGFQLTALLRRLIHWLLPTGWRGKASLVLALALLIEIVGVMGGGTFMRERMAQVELDFGSRVAHWQRGVSLLKSPLDWAFGIGMGRLPEAYSALGPDTEKSGSVQWRSAIEQGGVSSAFVHLKGPATQTDLSGLYSLTQRVDWAPGDVLRTEVRVRVKHPTVLRVKVCEKHVLYDGTCTANSATVLPVASGWQWVVLPLGPQESYALFDDALPYAPRFAVMSVTVLKTGGAVDIDEVRLLGAQHHELLSNGDFAAGMAHWFPAAQRYYLPWHIDNLFLEVLIERGALSLILAAGVVLLAFGQLAKAASSPQSIAPFVAAALLGALLVGLVSSLMDSPRVAFLLLLLTFFALHLKPDTTCTIRD